MHYKKKIFLAILFIAACLAIYLLSIRVRPIEEKIWTKATALIPSQDWPEQFDDMDLKGLREAIKESLAYYGRQDPKAPIAFGSQEIPVSNIVNVFNQLLAFLDTSPSNEALSKYLKSNFSLYSSAEPDVLFTGYYIPHLYGSLVRTEQFAYPIYAAPSDLVEVSLDPSINAKLPKDFPVINRGRMEGRRVVIPYFSREEIEMMGRLDGKRLELLWVDNKVDLFFLHIQGSGNIELPDGSIMRVGFADKNGQPYRAIGKTLLEKGLLRKGEITMFSIKDVLKNNPQIVDEVLNTNPSYVFFRPLNGPALGSLNVPVTSLRSIAVDQSLFPRGALGIIKTEKPVFDSSGKVPEWRPFTRLVMNQDTGGAIRGPGRVDIFMGDGKEAEAAAALMQQRGSLYFLAPIGTLYGSK